MLSSFLVEEKPQTYVADLPEFLVSAKYPTNGKVALLARLINAEAGGEPIQGQYAVASVVLNRMEYKKASIASIVFQSGQFDGVRSKRFRHYDRYQYIIAYKVLICKQRTIPSSVLYFHNKKTSTDTGWVAALSKYEWMTIGRHTFCHSKYLI